MTADRIADLACELCIEAGVGGLTMRSAAERAGVTPPAVVYHFRNREGLLLAALGAVERRRNAGWDDLAAALAGENGAGIDAEAALCAALLETIATQGLSFGVEDEIARALKGRTADTVPILQRMHDLADAFWRALPSSARFDADAQAVCAAVAEGLVSYAMLEPPGVRRTAQLVQLVARLFARLRGEPVAPVAPGQQLRPMPEEERPEGKQQIVDATIRLAGQLGIAGLTHRAIAAEAGLSVAATTYFYPTKEDILVDAARAVQARGVDAVVQGEVPPPQFMSRIALNAQGEERVAHAALAAFANAAIRLPDFHTLAGTFQSLRGVAAMRWLAARGHGEVDRLDGVLWSAAVTALTRRALLLPPAERAAFLDTTAERWLARLYRPDTVHM